MDAYDPARSIGLVIDEWGTWHPQAQKDNGLEQQNTVRDALVAALNLDIFVRNADVVTMTNIAQTVNVLQAMILTKGEKMILTPTYHVFEAYRRHQAAQSVKVLIDSPVAQTGSNSTMPLVSGSASVKDGRLFLTLTNVHLDQAVEVEVVVLGADRPSVRGAKGLQIAGTDVHDYNDFDQPDNVRPLELQPFWKGGDRSALRLPAHSVSALDLELA
jgi:alpha-N-arabinofuranosidase